MTPESVKAIEGRFWGKIEIHGHCGCWLWTASKNNNGYGWFSVGRRMRLAHRAAYLMMVGTIPPGMTIDHICRVRHCVNPSHLRIVTQRDNLLNSSSVSGTNAAKTHCPNGHPYSQENTYAYNGARQCSVCRRSYYARNAETMRAKQQAYRLQRKDIGL